MLNRFFELVDPKHVVFCGFKPRPGTPSHGAYDCLASVPPDLIIRALQIHRPDLEIRIKEKGATRTGGTYQFDKRRGFLFT